MVITKDPESKGWYNVVVPELPGCFSDGRSVKEAVANGADAIALYVNTLGRQRLPILMEVPA